jgi:murein DD-endopeptidase MepM/ murein hydrolase activator NlpD
MRLAVRSLVVLLGLVAAGVALPGRAAAERSVGAATMPSEPRSGGAEFGQPNGRPSAMHPVATTFRIGRHTLVEGTAPRLAIRIDQRGVRSVTGRVVFRPIAAGHGTLAVVRVGRIPTGRLLHPAWPSNVALKPGRYLVSLHAAGPAGGQLLRRASASGKAPLTVKPKPKPKPPAPPPVVAPPPAPAPDPAATSEGVFPVAGPHTYGDGFGAGREGHSHEGQDILAAEGTPVVAPLAGTIVARDYQASAAGFFLTLDATDGRSFFFAHCQQDTFAVTVGQAVGAGQQLCRVGHTGDATGPHLHVEIWIGGWRRDSASAPIDPLAQLQAWDR